MERDPQQWTESELKRARDVAERRFVLERKGEGPDAFRNACELQKPVVSDALARTGNLRRITGVSLLADARLWQTLRYFCAPPISEEDLWTLTGGVKFKRIRPELAEPTAEALRSVIDTWRFPWVAEERDPGPTELDAAVLATTVLLAHETLKTQRRGSSSRIQESEVATILGNAGFVEDSTRTAIRNIDDLDRGSFSRERKLDGAKCDIPVRLRDGRLLAIECKVSNGPKNSWKRLQREVGGKAERWRQEFGSRVLTGAVLAGVFDLRCLVNAQRDQRVFLFWQHDLGELATFVSPET